MNNALLIKSSRQASSSAFAALGLGLVLVVGSIFTGLILAYGGIYAALFVVSIMLFFVGMFMPLRVLILVIFAIVYLVVGQLQYFARIDKAFWIPYLLGLFLYVRLLANSILHHQSQSSRAAFGSHILMFFGLFFLVALASSVIRGVPIIQFFVAGKEYFFLFSILLAFLIGAARPRDLDRVFRFVPWFLALQVPVVIYQRFIVARGRSGPSSFDAVVGLFGGDPNGGGASGAMAIFGLVAIAFAVEGWRAKSVSGRRALTIFILAAVSIVLAEVKFALILLPILAVMIFARDILRHPGKAVAGLISALLLTWALLAVYQYQFTSTRSKQGKSLESYVETIIERNTGAEFINMRTGEMGRAASFVHWWKTQSSAGPTTLLLGYGIGATRAGSLVVGELAKQYHFKLGRSSMVLYLWEIGLIGTSFVVTALALSAFAARRLSANPAAADRAWLLRAASIGLSLNILALPYNTDFADVAQIQILCFSLIGYVIAVGREIHPSRLSIARYAAAT